MTKVTKYFRRVIWCIFACILLHDAFCSQVSFDYEEVDSSICVRNDFEVTCSSTTSVLCWGLLTYPLNCQITDNVCFNPLSSTSDAICNFSLELLSRSPYTSTATLANVSSNDSGIVLSCQSSFSLVPEPDEIVNITISVRDPSMAPLNPKIIPRSLISVIFTWTPPNVALCITNYTITITNITAGNASFYVTTTNITNTTVSDLTQGAEYSFTVAGVDAEGRVGEESISSQDITLDTPEKVTQINATVKDSIVYVSWVPPPPSSRPPVTGYQISHNITGNFTVNKTNNTNIAFENVVPGAYLFTVLAVSVLGDGDPFEKIIMILGSSPVLSASLSEGSQTVNPSFITRSSFGTMTTIGIPSTSNAVSSNPVVVESHISVIIGSIVGGCIVIAAIAIMLLFILIKTVVHSKTKMNQRLKVVNAYDNQQEPLEPQYSAIVLDDMPSPTVSDHPPATSGPLSSDIKEVPSIYSEVKLVPKHERVQYTQEQCEYSKLGEFRERMHPCSLASQEGAYSVLGGMKQDINVEEKVPGGILYATLGERSRDAPMVLPPERPVVYCDIRSVQQPPAAESFPSAFVGHAQDSPLEVPPPLPPKPE